MKKSEDKGLSKYLALHLAIDTSYYSLSYYSCSFKTLYLSICALNKHAVKYSTFIFLHVPMCILNTTSQLSITLIFILHERSKNISCVFYSLTTCILSKYQGVLVIAIVVQIISITKHNVLINLKTITISIIACM